jgi:predicted GNAT family acetyltransferase
VETEEANREESNAALISALGMDAPAGESSWELDVVNDAERGRWIALLGAEAIGELTYRFVGGRVVLLSTWVNHSYRNRRVATELVHRALVEIRGTGKKITIICPVVGEFIARNPEFLGLIDEVHPGSGAYPAHAQELVGASDDERHIVSFEHDMQ